MRSLSKMTEALFNEGILENRHNNIYYEEEYIGDYAYWTTPNFILTEVGNTLVATHGWITNVRSPTTQQFVDVLYWNVHPMALLFNNGNVRQTFIKEFLERHDGYLPRKNWYVTNTMAKIISDNWENIPEGTKFQIGAYFDSNGNYVGNYTKKIILTSEGNFEEHHINPTLYRSCHPTITNIWARAVVSIHSPLDYSMKFHDETISVTKEEFLFISKHYKVCSGCNCYALEEDFVFGLCSSCVGDFPKELAGYTARATNTFDAVSKRGGKFSDVLLGVELEYEFLANESKLETLYLLHKNLKDHAIFKRDGSLNNGLEICTRPASLEIHTEEFQKMFDDAQLMERLLVKSTCGMHVHIDRRKMSSLTLGKLIKFIQARENKPFLEKIAERSSNNYFKLSTDLSITSYHRTGGSSDRYQALNTTNTQTAEIRIFKTPDLYSSFAKNIEFVSALTDYVQPANSGIKELTTDHFTNFVKGNRGIYKNLHKYIKENVNV